MNPPRVRKARRSGRVACGCAWRFTDGPSRLCAEHGRDSAGTTNNADRIRALMAAEPADDPDDDG